MVCMGNVEDMADEGGSAATDPVVTLQPFVHQVGGHTRMLLLDSATICKPLIARELNFYRSVPLDIKEFTPTFKGVIQVSMEQDRDFVTVRNVSPSSSVSRNLDQRHAEPDLNKSKGAKECLSVKVIPEESPRSNRLPEKGECSRLESHHDSYFLMLENVASAFYRPCILDLKMGTRQHGDDAPEEKRHRHMAKCAASTSASLGVRVCGMQVYQADLGMYLCKDKYYGRGLDEDGFKQALHEFFHNGFTMRTREVRQVIDKLRRLRRAVEKQNSYRFYSSSLLVIYEGCVVEEEDDEPDAGAEPELESESESEPAGRCCDSCCDSEMELSSSSWDTADVDVDVDADAHTDTDVDVGAVCRRLQQQQQQQQRRRRQRQRQRRPLAAVDVRMIDFAHATYDGYVGDSMVHRGPDNGYLLGLDNLCRVLHDILAEIDSGCGGKE